MKIEEYLDKVTLKALAAGAAGERFDHVMEDIIKNIRDVNTDAKAPRKISLEITVRPNEDREHAEATLVVKTTLSPIKSYAMAMYVRRDDEGQLCLTMKSPQQDIEDQLDHTSVAGKIEPPKKAGNT